MTVKFDNPTHEFYCGIDLHANSVHVYVADQIDNRKLHGSFNTKTPETLILPPPFQKGDIIPGHKSTFTWYGLADLWTTQNLPSLL